MSKEIEKKMAGLLVMMEAMMDLCESNQSHRVELLELQKKLSEDSVKLEILYDYAKIVFENLKREFAE